uniref:CD99 antigen-like isoform X2 n=1 Tax=Myxine glutinosa TaxID=7769 RepID=UPI00358E2B8F
MSIGRVFVLCVFSISCLRPCDFDDDDLLDLVKPETTPVKRNNQPGSNFKDSDLFDNFGTDDSGRKAGNSHAHDRRYPEPGKRGYGDQYRGGYDSGNQDFGGRGYKDEHYGGQHHKDRGYDRHPESDDESAASSGASAGIAGAVLAAVLAAVSSFIAYQKRRLCFRFLGNQNAMGPAEPHADGRQRPHGQNGFNFNLMSLLNTMGGLFSGGRGQPNHRAPAGYGQRY